MESFLYDGDLPHERKALERSNGPTVQHLQSRSYLVDISNFWLTKLK